MTVGFLGSDTNFVLRTVHEGIAYAGDAAEIGV